MSESVDITKLCRASQKGDADAAQMLFEHVYQELRKIARSRRARWRGNDTLDTTALIHETYLKMAGSSGPEWQNRSHFFATASRAMRQVLVNYAERSRAEKRGGDAAHLSFEDDLPVNGATLADLLSLHEALERLAARHPRRSQIVECRLFGGLTNEEIASALGISVATVKRDWTLARAELYESLADISTDHDPDS